MHKSPDSRNGGACIPLPTLQTRRPPGRECPFAGQVRGPITLGSLFVSKYLTLSTTWLDGRDYTEQRFSATSEGP